MASAGRLVFHIVPGLTARDRAATIAVLENAQWVYALSRYPKKQVLDDEIDVKMLRDRIGAMRKDPLRVLEDRDRCRAIARGQAWHDVED